MTILVLSFIRKSHSFRGFLDSFSKATTTKPNNFPSYQHTNHTVPKSRWIFVCNFQLQSVIQCETEQLKERNDFLVQVW